MRERFIFPSVVCIPKECRGTSTAGYMHTFKSDQHPQHTPLVTVTSVTAYANSTDSGTGKCTQHYKVCVRAASLADACMKTGASVPSGCYNRSHSDCTQVDVMDDLSHDIVKHCTQHQTISFICLRECQGKGLMWGGRAAAHGMQCVDTVTVPLHSV
jgi:hypothetical protein